VCGLESCAQTGWRMLTSVQSKYLRRSITDNVRFQVLTAANMKMTGYPYREIVVVLRSPSRKMPE
jgi:hypothetical protein